MSESERAFAERVAEALNAFLCVGRLRRTGKVDDLRVPSIDQVLDGLLYSSEVVYSDDICLNTFDILEKNKRVVNHLQFEEMFDLCSAFDHGSYDSAFDILG